MTIYPVFMQILLCFIVPCAFIGVIPAMVITRKLATIYIATIFVVASMFMALAVLIFNRGIMKYESAGM